MILATLMLLNQPASAKTLFVGDVTVTSYNSLAAQTQGNPFITATGTRTRPGVIAVSRDLVRAYGYGAKLKIVSWKKTNGCNPQAIPKNVTYRIEDTMHPRWNRKIDIWLPSRSQSINFGKCIARVEIYK